MAGELNIVVGELAELDVIETELLLLDGNAEGETGDEVHEEEEDAGEGEGPGEGSAGTGDLVAELDPVVLNPADGVVLATVEGGNGGAKEEVSVM